MRFTLLVFLVVFCFGCNRPLVESYHEVNADSTWSVILPEGLEVTTELHDFAPIQYWNEDEGFFVLGLRESKTDLEKVRMYYRLEDYSWFSYRQICNHRDTCFVMNEALNFINGLNCIDREFITIISKQEPPMEVFYKVVVCEGKKYFYQLLTWTSKNNSMKYRAILDSIGNSIKEL